MNPCTCSSASLLYKCHGWLFDRWGVPYGMGCRAYLEAMMVRVFGPSSLFAADKLRAAATSGTPVNMEALFSQLTLDIIGE